MPLPPAAALAPRSFDPSQIEINDNVNDLVIGFGLAFQISWQGPALLAEVWI
jgi:hypothetical protein